MSVTVDVAMPRIAAIEPAGGYRVRVTWKKHLLRPRKVELVDLAPLIECLKFYKPLRDDQELFDTIHIVNDGSAVAWGDDDAVDMAATSIERLAEETFTADDFRDFLKANGLTHSQAAAQFGYSRRQIENYLSGDVIPRVVALACFGYAARKQQLKSRFTIIDGGKVRIDGRHLIAETGDRAARLDTTTSSMTATA